MNIFFSSIRENPKWEKWKNSLFFLEHLSPYTLYKTLILPEINALLQLSDESLIYDAIRCVFKGTPGFSFVGEDNTWINQMRTVDFEPLDVYSESFSGLYVFNQMERSALKMSIFDSRMHFYIHTTSSSITLKIAQTLRFEDDIDKIRQTISLLTPFLNGFRSTAQAIADNLRQQLTLSCNNLHEG